jgi:hypothetical protein
MTLYDETVQLLRDMGPNYLTGWGVQRWGAEMGRLAEADGAAQMTYGIAIRAIRALGFLASASDDPHVTERAIEEADAKWVYGPMLFFAAQAAEAIEEAMS